MLPLPAKTVYIDPGVYDHPRCRNRLERIWPHVKCDDVRRLDRHDLENVLSMNRPRHGKDNFGDDAILIFTTFDESRREWFYHWRDATSGRENHGGQCQSALELNLVDGCVFRCAYCGFGRHIVFHLDVEHFVEGLDEVFARHPSQRLYKYSNMTDLPPFEPELDATRPLVERFAREPDRYLMLFTKSDNVDFLTELDHRGRTIVSWSLTCDTASRVIDKRTASLPERITAMEKVQHAGYPVRARLSPIVPVVHWQNEYRELFERLFRHVQPDLVTLELLGWMEIRDVFEILDRSQLDPEMVANAEAARQELAGLGWAPFSQSDHEKLYRFCIDTVRELSPATPVSVCHATPSTWKTLGPAMRMSPDNYLCNCGSHTAPGGPLYDEWNPPGPCRTGQ